MVNALQCRADVIVQKSLAEGFGLVAHRPRGVLAKPAAWLADQPGSRVRSQHRLSRDPACASP
jgi:hypothetical protein